MAGFSARTGRPWPRPHAATPVRTIVDQADAPAVYTQFDRGRVERTVGAAIDSRHTNQAAATPTGHRWLGLTRIPIL
ncbi:MAG TPA: hypothetical protein VE196_11125 [Pseudonocardiaceae bacterium]|nr:hypothetical protein [Pseudonocardiaceae bacterium]